MIVASVLRSGGEYGPEHVAALARDVRRHLPGVRFVCFSDVPVPCERVALASDWPGWWAKMEVFGPALPGRVLYLDLDTVVRGSLADLAAVKDLTLLRDFYRPRGLGSGLMMLPAAARDQAYRAFIRAPEHFMARHRKGGDQAFLERLWLRTAHRWQDRCPGQVASYKADCRRGVPPRARVVCFHGQPRPWATELWRPADADTDLAA